MIQTKNMIAAAVLAALPVFAGTNLVPNPGFEQERRLALRRCIRRSKRVCPGDTERSRGGKTVPAIS